MTQRQHTYVITMSGAMVGAAASYFLFTDRGRVLVRQIGSLLDELEPKLTALGGTIERTLRTASESWNTFNEAVGHERSSASSAANPRISH